MPSVTFDHNDILERLLWLKIRKSPGVDGQEFHIGSSEHHLFLNITTVIDKKGINYLIHDRKVPLITNDIF